MLDRTVSENTILQKHKLQSTVEDLCCLGRRAISKQETQETLEFLEGKITDASLDPQTSDVIDISGNELEYHVGRSIAFASKARPNKLAKRQKDVAKIDLSQGTEIKNIYTQIGNNKGRKIIIGAHYDTHLFLQPGAGADDNASGVACVLELAERLKEHEEVFKKANICLEFVLFGAEEAPFHLLGSKAYASEIKQLHQSPDFANRYELPLMINLDMVGYFDPEQNFNPGKNIELLPQVTIERAFLDRFRETMPEKEIYYMLEANPKAYRRNFPQALVKRMRRDGLITELLHAARLNMGTMKKPNHFKFVQGRSDHCSFQGQGFPAFGISANPNRNPYYHKDSDEPKRLDYGRMSILVDSLVNYLLDIAKQKDPAYAEPLNDFDK